MAEASTPDTDLRILMVGATERVLKELLLSLTHNLKYSHTEINDLMNQFLFHELSPRVDVRTVAGKSDVAAQVIRESHAVVIVFDNDEPADVAKGTCEHWFNELHRQANFTLACFLVEINCPGLRQRGATDTPEGDVIESVFNSMGSLKRAFVKFYQHEIDYPEVNEEIFSEVWKIMLFGAKVSRQAPDVMLDRAMCFVS